MIVLTKLFLIISLFICLDLSGQIKHGRYVSDKTTFKDEHNPDNNFIELTRNNVLIDIREHKDVGEFIFEDPRMPDKKLRYRVLNLRTYREDDRQYYIYTCRALHFDSPLITEIIIYWNINEQMQIMIYDESSSQVFHDLNLINKD